MSWSDEFEDDPVPRFRKLHDAANYTQKRPKAQLQLPHWQAALEALIMAAEGRGPLLHARVGMLRAINHGHERVFWTDRKEGVGQAEAEAGPMKDAAICVPLPVSNVVIRRYFGVRAKPVGLVAGAQRRHNRGCQQHHRC